MKKGRKRQSKYSPDEPDRVAIRVWWGRVKDQAWKPGPELVAMIPYLVNAPKFRGLGQFKFKEAES